MKGHVRIVLALILVFTASLAVPSASHAGDDVYALIRVSSDDSVPGDDGFLGNSGPVSETDGDPDGWLGGQNLKPKPPEEPSGATIAGESTLLSYLLNLFNLTRWIGIG